MVGIPRDKLPLAVGGVLAAIVVVVLALMMLGDDDGGTGTGFGTTAGSSDAGSGSTAFTATLMPPTPVPSTPTPAGLPSSLADGLYVVGVDIAPRTYAVNDQEGCFWGRLSGFSGQAEDLITNDFRGVNGPVIITIEPSDAGFSSEDCGTWTPKRDPSGGVLTTFGDGIYAVGQDIQPGTYQTNVAGNDRCFWARLSGFNGDLENTITNDFVTISGQGIVTIQPADIGFLTEFCGIWEPL